MELLLLSFGLLLGMLAVFSYYGKSWSDTNTNFLFANRTLQTVSSGLAISSHWFWAIAIFVGPAVAYNWGIIGLLWFAIPNALSLIVVGWLAKRLRSNYTGWSLTEYIKERFSKRVSTLFQVEFLLISFAALILAFTAISKLWSFVDLGGMIAPVYASLLVGLITLGFTIRGDIRTSIFTGASQTVLWVIFLGLMMFGVYNADLNYFSLGKNELTTFFDEKFITTFAVAWFIPIIVGATSHGMMWQKAFSMPKQNIMPSFTLAAVFFLIVSFTLASLGMVAFANGLSVTNPEHAQMIAMNMVAGQAAVIIFGTILIGQTSTVIDSSLNYVSSLVSREWLSVESVNGSRIIMALFLLAAWAVSWFKLDIWTILMLMGAVRIVMFVPLVFHLLHKSLSESVVFYSSIVGIVATFYLAYLAKVEKVAIYNMYSALIGLAVPTIALLTLKLKDDH